jgi:hypothetical protein
MSASWGHADVLCSSKGFRFWTQSGYLALSKLHLRKRDTFVLKVSLEQRSD